MKEVESLSVTPAAAVAEAAVHSTAPASAPGGGAHLASLDGARGLAALYVVFHHAYYLCLDPNGNLAGVPRYVAEALKPLAYGRTAVDLFIVLSGFVLMMPVVRSADRRLRGGTFSYLQRRARRILPPYYAALALTLLLIAVQPMAMVAIDGKLTSGSVIAHGLMIHNFRDIWNRALNAPMWSVATEWDIYFVFPLILLPVWRRFGVRAMLTVAAVVSVAPQIWGRTIIDWAAPWFVMLFAMGAAGAALTCSPGLGPHERRSIRRLSGLFAIAGIPLFLGCYAVKRRVFGDHFVAYQMCSDFTVGLAGACFIIYCAAQPSPGAELRRECVSPLVRFLQSPAPIVLGGFSYSLYLTHWPMLALAHGWASRSGMATPNMLGFMLLIVVPLAAAASYVFYLLFEKPFLAKKRKAAARANRTFAALDAARGLSAKDDLIPGFNPEASPVA